MKKIIAILSLLFSTFFLAQRTHTVVKGDNPFRISQTYGIPLEQIYKLNPELKNTPLSIGQVIKLSNQSTPKLGKIVIQPKQTIYGITKQYHISEKELRKLNPNLDNQMKIGDHVTLPWGKIEKYANGQEFVDTVTETQVKEVVEIDEKESVAVETNYNVSHVSSDNYIVYKVKKDDTLFGIVNAFHVSVDNLAALNPDLSNGLKPGMKLKIKESPKSYSKADTGVLNVAIILPFGYEDNDSKYRKMSLEFLKGVQFALEKNAGAGKKIRAKIIDGGMDKNFKKSLSKIDKTKTDLIIGPLFKGSLLELLDYVKEEQIPVVAPFANSEDLYHYSNLIMITSSDQSYAERLASEIVKESQGQDVFIVSDNDYGKFIQDQIKKNLPNINVNIVKSANNITLQKNMMTGQTIPSTFVLATNDKNEGQIFASKLIELTKDVQGIKAYSMYYVSTFDKKAEDLKKAKLLYLMDRKINKAGSFEKEILSAYKSKYCESSPSRYATIGFDITNDMLSRENAKGEIFKQIDKTQTQLATKFKFVEAKKGGAYINTGYRVVRLK